MYCSVHRPNATPGASSNKGTCMLLVRYLSKEGGKARGYYDDFFSHSLDFVLGEEVQKKIDNNHRSLKTKDDKFYMLSINPSHREAQHLIKEVTGRENVNEFDELTTEEKEAVIAELKNYARTCMDEYALNFYRDKIKGGEDLVYFGRVETERHYKGDAPEVKRGEAVSGDKKPGLNLHVHIVVSRMDKSQTVSLSPLTRSRGNRQVLDGKEVVVGFNRSEWAERCATRFNDIYHYRLFREEEYYKIRKKFDEWESYNRMQAEAIRTIKEHLLQGQLYYERKLLEGMVKTYRFIVNVKSSFMSDINLEGNKIRGKGY